MGAPLNRSLAATLLAGVVGSGALLGGGAAVHHDRRPVPVDAQAGDPADPADPTMPFALEACDLGDGRTGHLYGTICSFAPPAGWVAPSDSSVSGG